MKYYVLTFLFLSIVSCSRNSIVYNTGSNMDDVSQVPITSKQEGDLDINISGSSLSETTTHTGYYYDFTQVIFRSFGNNHFNTNVHYSIRDHIALGVNYQRIIKNNNNLSNGHSFGPSINYSKNKYTKNQKAVYGFDVLGSVQYRTAKNSIYVNEMYKTFFPFIFPFWGEISGDTISGIQIQQQMLKFSIQPSVSIEMKNFHLFFGAAVVYQNQFKYTSPQLSPNEVQLVDVNFEEPFGYYSRKKSEWTGHIFYGFGVGPSIARLNMKIAHVASTDPFNKNIIAFNLGVTSNFNVKKENRKDPKFSPSRRQSKVNFFL